VPLATGVVPHASAVQVLMAQVVPVAGQSLAIKHATQLPLPSHRVPPWSLHTVPDGIFADTHAFAVQTFVAHDVPVDGQSLAVRHAMQLPFPSQRVPPLALQGVPEARFFEPQHSFSQVAMAQSPVGGVQFAGEAHATVHAAIPPIPLELVLVLEALLLVAAPAVPPLLPAQAAERTSRPIASIPHRNHFSRYTSKKRVASLPAEGVGGLARSGSQETSCPLIGLT
jgi:hypothetical protein